MTEKEQKTLEDHQKLSDEDLIGMYAKEFESDPKSKRLSCPGCTSVETCQCAAESDKKK